MAASTSPLGSAGELVAVLADELLGLDDQGLERVAVLDGLAALLVLRLELGGLVDHVLDLFLVETGVGGDRDLRLLAGALSLAETWTMPLASMSKVTSICGTPRGAGGMPPRLNLPRVRLSPAIERSPWHTWTSTEGWLSAAVVKVSDLRVGIVVLRGMSTVITPPRVSMPRTAG
jgi:hypothetical protein